MPKGVDVGRIRNIDWLTREVLAAGNTQQECMVWPFPCASNYVSCHDPEQGKNDRIHRISFRIINGEIPDGYEIDHTCLTKHCFNPTHLEAVPVPVHKQRSFERGQIFFPGMRKATGPRKSHCSQGHELSGDNLSVLSRGDRKCKTCERARSKRRYSQKRERVILGGGTGE